MRMAIITRKAGTYCNNPNMNKLKLQALWCSYFSIFQFKSNLIFTYIEVNRQLACENVATTLRKR
jgi:hypothetical protein